MNILVTGCGSFIGSEIAKKLSYFKKYNVHAVYNKKKPKKNPNIKYFKRNLEKKIEINEDIKVIIHVASKVVSDGNNFTNFKKNIKMTNNILKLSLEKKVRKIIFLSTLDVYGNITEGIIDENYPKHPLSYYGKSKYESEKIISKFCKKQKIVCSIFRLPVVIGKNSTNNFLSSMKKNINLNKKIKVGNLEKKFNGVMHIRNLCLIIKKSLNIEKSIEIYNLASKGSIKIDEIVSLFYRKLKKTKNIMMVKKKRNFLISLKKIKKKYRIMTTKSAIIMFLSD
tara:strand:+ start:2637 stop:3482 length:846 start_codon:yes stop_codon:yes gene_type:complete